MPIDEIALRIFCAMLTSGDGKISLYPEPGEQQIRMAFELARVFKLVSDQAQLAQATNEANG